MVVVDNNEKRRFIDRQTGMSPIRIPYDIIKLFLLCQCQTLTLVCVYNMTNKLFHILLHFPNIICVIIVYNDTNSTVQFRGKQKIQVFHPFIHSFRII